MPEQQNFVSYVLLQLQTPKAYYCKETKKKVLAARWLPCMSFSFSQVGQKKSEEVSLFCTSSFAISAIRRSKNEKFFAKKRESWSFYCCCHATLRLEIGCRGVVRKIGNCFGGGASPCEEAATVAEASVLLLHFFFVGGRKDNTRLIGTLRA